MEFRFNDEFKITSLKRFDELRKELLLQSASIFNEKNLNTYNCIELMINFIYLLNQGEKFSNQEKEFLFFGVSKLFPSSDLELRRIVFLFLKTLNYYENSFMLNGALVNEINKSDSFLKGSSFRFLGRIVDVSGVAPIERLLKNAISSNTADVCSSAVLCALYMSIRGFNIARPWISEITDKLNSSLTQSNLVTFHTLLLLREIRDNDKLYLLKTYLNLSQSGMRSQFATCQLIRYIVEFLQKGQVEDPKTLSSLLSYLESSMFKTQQEAVSIEAARGILELPNVKSSLLTSTFETLKSHLNNGKRVVKYSALKTLDKAANKFAKQLSLDIFLDLEKIIDDNVNNASIKAIALSIFLKISKGLSDYRLEKMFKTFTDQYTTFKEEFKKDIVIISKEISREDPVKNKLYLNFFSSLLKLEAGLQTKIEILDAIIWYIYNDQNLKKTALLCLAEYIEDCQFDNLKTRILSVLGKEGMSANSPSQLVRYIYNRIILENAFVRAAAVSALGDIGFKNENLRKNIINLIKNSLHDIDNEVRERAYFYVKALTELESDEKSSTKGGVSIKNYIFGGKKYDIDLIQNLLKLQKDQLLSSDNIALELSNTLNDPEKIKKVMSTAPIIKENIAKTSHSSKILNKSEPKEEQIYPGGEDFKKTVFYKSYGHPKKVSKSMKLTDQYAEYPTSYRKIIYDKIVILDFEVKNTLEENLLKNITIELTELSPESGFDFSKSEIIEIDQLKYNEEKHIFFKLVKSEEETYGFCAFGIFLKFDVQELDSKGNAHGSPYKDQYKIDSKVTIKYSDYFMSNPKVDLNNFEEFWNKCEKSNFLEFKEKLQLPYSNMKLIGKNFSNVIGFETLNDVDKVDQNAKKYEFVYSVMNIYGAMVFLRLQVIFNQSNQCLSQISIRSQDDSIDKLILDEIYKG